MKRNLQSRAFSLIELLVVVAILGLLAALLLPSLSRSKASAQTIKCAGNLRQLGLAAQMYWDDYNGNCFRYRGGVTNNGDFYWFGWLERGAESTRAFDPTPGALYPYLNGRGVEVCPALKYSSVEFKLKAVGAAYGYGYNLNLSAPINNPAFNLSRIGRMNEIVLLADCAQINTFQPPASPSHPMLEEFYYVNESEATAHFRHRQLANVLFCDAHVGREKPVQGSIDQNLPREMVGRLHKEVLTVP
jgi:prepilin-type N-terminal cleavage/methylation domain-containing protein/prepilin-type processing-associated H-X9-DG protein